MKQIWKFAVPTQDEFVVPMPTGAEILSVQIQNGWPVMWALVDPAEPKELRSFRVAGTGHNIPPLTPLRFVGTYQLHGGALVFHLFEAGEE